MADLSVKIAGVEFPNPVIAASGTYGNGECFTDLYPLSRLGGISCKGMTIVPKMGNVPPRIAETPSGILNSVGLQNIGVHGFIEYYLPTLKEEGNVIIANVAGATIDDYIAAAEALDVTNVDMIELNISCPNVKAGGATLFRGGAYKPRTSPYSFQGLETEGILDMVKAREATGMPIVSELMSEDRIPEFEEYVDVVQIGARNMQNFQLLKAVGKMHKPVLLKRGLCNTIEEWIMSAEYIMAGGNEQVILCERGIRTFEKYTRNTLDLSAVPIIHEKTHLPVIVDPSHATGKANLVEPMMIAAVAAGADGLEVEVHYDPRHAWSDGAQCLTPDAFAQAMAKCRQVAWAIGRDM